MDSRRDFLKKAALLAAGSSLAGAVPESILRALAIEPAPGSTYRDAEHVVILMQENRSFDHLYGTLRGVRGFDDPRAVVLPNGNPVWLQSNAKGETYAPFRLNIKDTRATWMSSLPHTWVDQTDARNGGRHDGWLEAKRSARAEYADMPLTLGYYTREDLPFYYALADGFTVCDQTFCSSLTGTTPNRLYLWTGTIRDRPSVLAKANVRNEDVDDEHEVGWTTYPERLTDAGVSWRIYQNEINLDTGLSGDEVAWLGNFSDNPIEWFTQYNVRAASVFRRNLPDAEAAIEAELARLQSPPAPSQQGNARHVQDLQQRLERIRRDRAAWTEARVSQLSARERQLHERAFATNALDSDYRALTTLRYDENGAVREMTVPKGDVLAQFRHDVENGELPTVSWVVAPENFSDHPSAPWYGAWYLSEVFDILTKNPSVWQKTVFILCYDENDGYFDHVPPFVPPNRDRPASGAVSSGIDTSVEHVRIEQEQERQRAHPGAAGRAGPIGLGFRVPLVIASPWTRGGYVCSEVFDHTSVLRFLEAVLARKTSRPVRETNISAWRRTVCGDLTSAFRAASDEAASGVKPVEHDAFLASIHEAQFKPVPSGFKALDAAAIAEARKRPASSRWLPRQERGARPSVALPYELAATGSLGADRRIFSIRLAAERTTFGERAAGAPFHVYTPAGRRDAADTNWAYAVAAGDSLVGKWALEDFEDGRYDLRVHGPNGFFRAFRGTRDDPLLEVRAEAARDANRLTGDLTLSVVNREPRRAVEVMVEDAAYGGPSRTIRVGDGLRALVVPSSRTSGWYDVRVRVDGSPNFEQRYAGRVETGRDGFSDPAIGRG